MKIHLNQIPEGGTLHIEGEAPADILDITDELIRVTSPVRYDLEVGISEGGLFATGRLSVDLGLECVTCLRPFEREIAIDDFAIQMELEGRETVDLTETIREDILLALPPHPHCDWSGEETCTGLGKKFESEPVITTKNPWAGLDAFEAKGE